MFLACVTMILKASVPVRVCDHGVYSSRWSGRGGEALQRGEQGVTEWVCGCCQSCYSTVFMVCKVRGLCSRARKPMTHD